MIRYDLIVARICYHVIVCIVAHVCSMSLHLYDSADRYISGVTYSKGVKKSSN